MLFDMRTQKDQNPNPMALMGIWMADNIRAFCHFTNFLKRIRLRKVWDVVIPKEKCPLSPFSFGIVVDSVIVLL